MPRDSETNTEAARDQETAPGAKGIQAGPPSLDDFWAYMPMHNYIFAPTRTTWPASSVNARIGPVKLTDMRGEPLRDDEGKQRTISPAAWLDRHRPVEQMTWMPGETMVIRDRIFVDGGWSNHRGLSCFNLYRPPVIKPGDAAAAEPWLDHIRLLYPEEAEHILDWLACRVQRPQDKINHALVFAGNTGIGKDSILAPVRHAVGPWNVREAAPSQLLGRFNGFLKAVILRVNEARDLGEFDRFALYDHMKGYIASPPEVLPIDEKNLREYAIPNLCGVVITTNHKTDGIYLPADDRRHFVAWSDLTKEDPRFQGGYWSRLYAYYDHGGNEAVAAFLLERDLNRFDPKAPPPQTAAFWAIADAYRPTEESEFDDLLDLMGRPSAFTLATLIRSAEGQAGADGGFVDWLKDRKNRRSMPHRLGKCGFVPVRNPYADDGLWRIRARRQVVYADKTLPTRDQVEAARRLSSS